MVSIINKRLPVFAGYTSQAQRKGIVIHNTAGASSAQGEYNRLAQYTIQQLQAGLAHYYVDEIQCLELVHPKQIAWHTATTDGNSYYIGIEACKSYGTSDSMFKSIEEQCFALAAQLCQTYGITPNRETIRLHKEFSATACPHRSWELHGKEVNAVKDYFIQRIKAYMNIKGDTETAATVNTGRTHVVVKGDTLYRLSLKYKLTVAELKTLNNLKSDTITIGQKLTIAGVTNTGTNNGATSVADTSSAAAVTAERIAKTGTFTLTVDKIFIRNSPNTTASSPGSYVRGQSVNYDSYCIANGYAWISYISYSGARRYLAVGPYDNDPNNVWGTGF